jgi:hypothetical protein
MDPMAFLTGITSAMGFYKNAVELRDEAQIAAATNRVQAELAIAGAHVLAMQKQEMLATEEIRALKIQIEDLKSDIAKLKARISDGERYELAQPRTGTFAYRLKQSATRGEPVHYLCQYCMDNRETKSILQHYSASTGKSICPACLTEYSLGQTNFD